MSRPPLIANSTYRTSRAFIGSVNVSMAYSATPRTFVSPSRVAVLDDPVQDQPGRADRHRKLMAVMGVALERVCQTLGALFWGVVRPLPRTSRSLTRDYARSLRSANWAADVCRTGSLVLDDDVGVVLEDGE